MAAPNPWTLPTETVSAPKSTIDEEKGRKGKKKNTQSRAGRSTTKGLGVGRRSKTEYRAHSARTTRFKPGLLSIRILAASFGLLDIVKDVIGEVKASKNFEDVLSEALDLAVGFGRERIVSLLTEEGAESNEAPEYGQSGR
ncbi:hypothetical protein EKO27_g5736 [Xylaria grammica]|uniref:Uncharacterized protein n=1 Tax=Xylaria grammica TaxID=363999 RepID=A0A439D4P6_9PEZI|nr:hypothetical protein EKO27_g5736 [Xylaria grammica]